MSYWVEKAERDLVLAKLGVEREAERQVEAAEEARREAAELVQKEAKAEAEVEALARSKFPPMGHGFQI